jgi:hypothetical protein
MARPSESHEHWERPIADLRAYRDTQRKAWGDLDDIQVAGYLAGTCSPQERTAVEQAMRDLPDVRELIDVLRSVLPTREEEAPVLPDATEAAASGNATRTATFQPDAAIPKRFRGRTLRRIALVGLGLAASFLLGWLVGRGRHGPEPSGQSGELVLAGLTAVPRDSRAAEAARVMLDDQGVYRIAGGRDFALQIRSPRRGVATLVLLGSGPPVVYPLPGQADIAVEPLEPRKFGPLDRPEARTTVLVLVTATPASDIIRQQVTAPRAALEEPDRLLAELEQALWTAGQRWVALGRITVEPLGRP